MKLLEWYELTILVAAPGMAGLVWLELGKTDLSRLFSPQQRTVAASVGDIGVRQEAGSALPDYLIESIICLQMEDHHVRIHVPGRSYLHFGVLRDIVGTLDEQRGLQVHRSWWVARSSVGGWRKEGRSVELILSNGLHVPVARNRVATLRARGGSTAAMIGLAERAASLPGA